MKTNNLAINPNGIAFDLVTGNSFKINELGIEILDFVNNGLDEEAIALEIQNKYDVDFDQALIDVIDFLTNLKIYGLGEA